MRPELDNDLLILIGDVSHHLSAYGDHVVQALGVTQAQLAAIVRLEQHPNLSQIELAALADVTPITIARLIDRLEKHGLITRCVDPDDRRVWRLRLTPAAAAIVREIGFDRANLNAVITQGISPAVLEAMVVGLRRMKANVSGARLAEANA
jgi:DNA-binding MarR family transcriptional regulator